MIFIGEKINGTRKVIQQAILDRDVDYIKQVVQEQVDSNADYLDVNAGTNPDRELEDMLWLIDIVQGMTDIPICIDSSSADTLKAALEHVSHTPMVNSINADPARLDAFVPLIAEAGCPVIALALDESKSGMPKDIDERMDNIGRIIEATRAAGIDDSKVFVDPLIMSVGTDQQAGVAVLDCIRAVRESYPEAHITGGLSNISFGLPNRAVVNRTFMTLAIQAGMDSAVCDSSNVSLIESMKATELLLGKDRFCRKYTKAAKKGFVAK